MPIDLLENDLGSGVSAPENLLPVVAQSADDRLFIALDLVEVGVDLRQVVRVGRVKVIAIRECRPPQQHELC